MTSADISWRNILTLAGILVAAACSGTFFVMQNIRDGIMDTVDERSISVDTRLGGLQRQIDQINDRLNAIHRDIEANGK